MAGIESAFKEKHRTLGGMRMARLNQPQLGGDRPVATPYQQCDLMRFFLAVFALSWGLWIAAALMTGLPIVLRDVLRIVGSWAPTLVALALTGRSGGRAATELLRQATGARSSWRWYAAVVLMPFAAAFAAFGLDLAFGGTLAPSGNHNAWFMLPVVFLYVLFLGGPLNEEFGWRGYALPRLLELRTPLAAALILGVIWALWHLPLALIPGTPQHGMPLVPYWFQLIAMSLLMVMVYLRSNGNLLLVILLHMAGNACAWLVPVLPVPGGSGRAFWILVALMWLVTLAAIRLGGLRPIGQWQTVAVVHASGK